MPELSVVIPTLGRSPALARALDALATQRDVPGELEVIVVRDAAGESGGAIEAAGARRDGRFRALAAQRPGASAARNLGWRAADSPLVLFLGDDILASPRLVAEHLAWHRTHPADEVGVLGLVRWARELRRTAFMRWLEHGIQFDYPAIRGEEAGWGRFYTANASVKRSLLERAGGFEEEGLPFLYEDLDLAYRMSRLGFRLLLNRRARAEHLHPTDLAAWVDRARLLGAAEREFVARHPEVQPYFHHLFKTAAAAPPGRRRGRHLIRVLPRWVPWLGARAWESADLQYRQALAPHFLRGWEGAQPSERRSETNT